MTITGLTSALALLLITPALGQVVPRAAQIIEPPMPLEPPAQERVVSSSKKFFISGAEMQDRSNLSILLEETQDELMRLTDEKLAAELGQTKVPIQVTLHGKEGDPLPRRITALEILSREAGYEVKLDLHLCRGIQKESFKRTTTAALICERTLRSRQDPKSDAPLAAPPWLVDGLLEATAWRLNQSDRRLYQALFKSRGLFKVEQLFSITDPAYEDLDAAMRAAFRASSGAMVMALLQQPQGKEGFRKFLTEVADYEGEMPALLRKHFPELNLSETSLAKWWALQLANAGGLKLLTEVMPITQTEQSLTEALKLDFRATGGIADLRDLSTWPELAAMKEQERAQAVQFAQAALVQLNYRAFPSYRPIINEYQIVLNSLVKNKTKDVEAQLKDLTERRSTMAAKVERARDYLDWFEITRARETSGVFNDYIRLKERLKSNPHRRDDPVSKYLDRMDEIFSREGDEKLTPQDPNAASLELPPLLDPTTGTSVEIALPR